MTLSDKINKYVLDEADVFLQDNCKVEPYFLAYLVSKGVIEHRDKSVINAGHGDGAKLETLLGILHKSPAATDVLIKYYMEEQKGQKHVADKLQELKTKAIATFGVSDTVNSANPSGSSVTPLAATAAAQNTKSQLDLTRKLNNVSQLATIIAQDPMAVEKWGSLIPALVQNAESRGKLSNSLKDRITPHLEVIYGTLEAYCSESEEPRTVEDFLNVLRPRTLNRLIGQLKTRCDEFSSS